MREQLLSYMRLLCCEIGIIVCDKIYVFYGYGREVNESKTVSIDFIADNPDGIKFINLFSRDSFNALDISTFFEDKSKLSNDILQIKSEITSSFILTILQEHFAKKYSQEAFEAVEKTLNIEINYLENASLENTSAPPPYPAQRQNNVKITEEMIKASYDIAKQVMDEKIKRSDAPGLLNKKFGMNYNSASIYVSNFIQMRKGDVIKKAMSERSYEIYLENIHQDYADAGVKLALKTVEKTVTYRDSFNLPSSSLLALIKRFEAKLQ